MLASELDGHADAALAERNFQPPAAASFGQAHAPRPGDQETVE